ncbi:hypothetical protein IM792_16080 [Mucilaginibacter sp. JRF]|uniref:hypothetical protein n=1 Tax=Mucilaginibacter sp. JRF TaxID=2780088 RepID=UPI001881D888|nr:hypothetical protein [Mucilaginibacter sp. JRF]MBE9585973.1 hypothetical protein [Mucilaginibacter sp. JRF]
MIIEVLTEPDKVTGNIELFCKIKGIDPATLTRIDDTNIDIPYGFLVILNWNSLKNINI